MEHIQSTKGVKTMNSIALRLMEDIEPKYLKGDILIVEERDTYKNGQDIAIKDAENNICIEVSANLDIINKSDIVGAVTEIRRQVIYNKAEC